MLAIRSVQTGTQLGDVAAFLDAYWERCVKPAGLRSLGSVRSQISVLKQHLGHLPLSALEEPDEINRFNTDSEYAEAVLGMHTSVSAGRRLLRRTLPEQRASPRVT
ncbi:MAG: hypothetical protein ACREA0_14010 [bacterium]